MERGIMRLRCLAQEHNTISPVRAQTQTACSRVECTYHEDTMPPLIIIKLYLYFWKRPFTCKTSISELLLNTGNPTVEIYCTYIFLFKHKHAACIPNIAESVTGTAVLLYLCETNTDASIPYCCISEAVMEK